MNHSPSPMKPSFTFASSTTVQPGRLKKGGKEERRKEGKKAIYTVKIPVSIVYCLANDALS
jgi:hypothetical protein